MYSFTRLCVQRVACGLIRQDKRLKGHAKWQNIAHTKALKDAEKSALTLAFSRRIKVAVAEGNNNTKPNENPRLSSILDEAKKKNIPIATLHGVLEKLEKSKTKSQTEFVDFRGPGGAYFIVKILSHNVVGAKMMLNTLFKKMKCKSIEGKSKGTLFEHLGCIITEHKDTLDSATEDAIAVGADDVEEFEADGKFYRFVCDPSVLPKVKNQLEAREYSVLTADDEMVPKNTIELSEDDLKRVDLLMEKLGAVDEIVSIDHNIQLPEEKVVENKN
ncbi:putative transcriptional regulatory protein Teth514_1449 [Cotesia typhae]|uniref:putative transcriptional regulatory protein Teth514_1449 n=1 Tax=Cotesia typhae TaxID=2053667 RepID=UPI003D687525